MRIRVRARVRVRDEPLILGRLARERLSYKGDLVHLPLPCLLLPLAALHHLEDLVLTHWSHLTRVRASARARARARAGAKARARARVSGRIGACRPQTARVWARVRVS